MSLRGQGGYAMAALLVALAVMAVLMSVALPVWRHEAQREKEEELVWRGQQYVRAIRLFQARTQTLPASFDLLVQGRYIRKKYKDPITGEDFLPVPAGGAIPGQGGGTIPGAGRVGTQTGQTTATQPSRTGAPPAGGGSTGSGSTGSGSSVSQRPSAFGPSDGGMIQGGMMGVVSKSKDESIRLYQGRNHYNEWTFLFLNQQPGVPGAPGGRGQPGGPGGQAQPGAPPGRGGRGTGPGRGASPFGVPGRGRL